MSATPFKIRHTRILKACDNCRQRKIKCSGESVCSYCKKYGDPCIYREKTRQSKKVVDRGNIDCGQEVLDMPTFLSVRKSSVNSSTMEYFGPASNFSFVNQLNDYLRLLGKNTTPIDEDQGLRRFGMNLMVLSNPAEDFDCTLSTISVETVNQLITAFLETWHIPCPIFTGEDLFDLSVTTWKQGSAPKHRKALLYLVLSIGAAASYFESTHCSASSTLPLARGFFELSIRTVPEIFTEVSFDAVRIIFLMSLSACNLGDTAQSYLYSGYSVRIAIALGLHKLTKFESQHQCRVWTCAWQWENYWSFCVGRPSCSREDMSIPMVPEDAFTASGYGNKDRFAIHHQHMELRVYFGANCSRIHSQLYDSESDLLAVLKSVEKLSTDIDNKYLGCSDPLLKESQVSDLLLQNTDANACREWFWIRIYYLYLKMVIYRPFMIFYAYLNNSKTEASEKITLLLKSKSNLCVQVAIDISRFIIDLNRKIKMRQPIFFICTYLESASTILLFFIISNRDNIPDTLAESIWEVLQDTCAFLSGSSGPYVGSIKIIANDALKSLHDILLSNNSEIAERTYFGKVLQGVPNHSPDSNVLTEPSSDATSRFNAEKDAQLGDMSTYGLEDFWQQTLDWISIT
ncbi:zinc finger protein [Scheffersomyces stipitis CBS 6054]|uniref:Zinc finger protein n=1 Tax=Scheffersomyces stipitis (strain ATCC 58785 / CBS 6054 / NBRC 10063 / NRRL Y-11545) TaxID=322104 RepID=A3LWM4_PICST|nr:zinc finger protein [Scheffersomyces stipitis CBS 6054]ABN67658.2 zinc finger protein [Scheffersomyces stipitis CBS 6054]